MLNAHGVQVEILPFFLGGARDGVGNPWTPVPQAKVAFVNQDTTMTGKILGLNIVPPEVFPISSLFASSPLLIEIRRA
jgi:glutathione S-transferase kappa 1